MTKGEEIGFSPLLFRDPCRFFTMNANRCCYSPRSMAAPLQRYFAGLLAIAGLVGAISTIAGLVEGSLVFALTSAGYVGFIAIFVGGIVSQFLESNPNGQYIAAAVGVGVGVICLLAFPFSAGENANDFNLLSALGIIFIVGAFILAVNAYDQHEKAKQPAQKTCPDCANEVFAAAKKCQHCGYRFEP